MNIEKLTCCLAKPMNAIRDLTAKVNEIITAHNDHLENHPAGGGESTTPAPSVGSGLFITCENGTPCDPISSGAMMAIKYQCNKTGGELIEAFKSGQYIAINFIDPLGEGGDLRAPCLMCIGTADAGAVTCGAYVNGVNMIGNVTWEGGVTSIIFEMVLPAG